jgi:hypothetical protein
LRATVEQHFHQANHVRVLDLYAGDFAFTRGDGNSQSLKQGKIDVDVEEFCF